MVGVDSGLVSEVLFRRLLARLRVLLCLCARDNGAQLRHKHMVEKASRDITVERRLGMRGRSDADGVVQSWA
jgi:hypothetical protein